MDGLDQPRRKAPSLSGQEGRCLDCHGMDHSLMNGTQSFIYASDCINPQLGQLGDNDDAYRFWQRRMQSHRCPTHVGGENARSSPCTAENTLRVATTTTVATTTGTPSLTSLAMVPHNNFNTAMQEALKAVAHRPTHLRSSSPSKACPQYLPTHQGCATGPLRTRTPTDASRGLSARADYPTAVRVHFPPHR